jgi:hypothetical protein
MVLLGATPVGWVIVLAAVITAGYLAAPTLDDLGKYTAGRIYDGQVLPAGR